MRFAVEQILDERADFRDSCRSPDQHYFVDLLGLEVCVFQRLLGGANGAIDNGLDQLLELLPGNFAPVAFAAGQFDIKLNRGLRRQSDLGFDDRLANRLHCFGVAVEIEA